MRKRDSQDRGGAYTHGHKGGLQQTEKGIPPEGTGEPAKTERDIASNRTGSPPERYGDTDFIEIEVASGETGRLPKRKRKTSP